MSCITKDYGNIQLSEKKVLINNYNEERRQTLFLDKSLKFDFLITLTFQPMIKEEITPGIPGPTHLLRAWIFCLDISHILCNPPWFRCGPRIEFRVHCDRSLLYLTLTVPHSYISPPVPDYPSHTGFYIQHTRPTNMNTAIVFQRPSNAILEIESLSFMHSEHEI